MPRRNFTPTQKEAIRDRAKNAAKSSCSIDGCDRTVTGQGLCNMHYRRWRRHGDPLGGQSTYRGQPLQFLESAILSAQDDCIVWPFSKLKNGGYGHVYLDGKLHTANRVVLIRVAGLPADPSMVAAHAPGICHNPACINPRHLRWATDAENATDRVVDGTENFGERQGRSKLTEAQVLQIFRDERNHSEIAAAYGVSRSHVSSIKRGDSWSWLTGSRDG
jgi:hypothetical protein